MVECENLLIKGLDYFVIIEPRVGESNILTEYPPPLSRIIIVRIRYFPEYKIGDTHPPAIGMEPRISNNGGSLIDWSPAPFAQER